MRKTVVFSRLSICYTQGVRIRTLSGFFVLREQVSGGAVVLNDRAKNQSEEKVSHFLRSTIEEIQLSSNN